MKLTVKSPGMSETYPHIDSFGYAAGDGQDVAVVEKGLAEWIADSIPSTMATSRLWPAIGFIKYDVVMLTVNG